MNAESEPMASEPPAEAPNLTGRSILVVDDDPIQRVLLVHAFWDAAANIYQAGDGAEALSLIASRQPDLVIMDARMPNLSGPETLAALVRAGHPTKLILTGGSASDFGPMGTQPANVVAVIQKPVRLERLRAIVFRALDDDARC